MILRAAAELDAVVEAAERQAQHGGDDDQPGDGVPEPGAADEVDRAAAAVEVVAEPAELAHQALPPAGSRSRPRFSASSPESLWPLLKNENRASQETIGLVKKKNTTRSISVERPSANAKPLHDAGREDVEDDGGEDRDRVGGHAGGPRADPAGLDRDPHRLARPHLVADALEEDDERVGGDADRDDQARDAGQGQREPGASWPAAAPWRTSSRRRRAASEITTSPRPR